MWAWFNEVASERELVLAAFCLSNWLQEVEVKCSQLVCFTFPVFWESPGQMPELLDLRVLAEGTGQKLSEVGHGYSSSKLAFLSMVLNMQLNLGQ